MYTMFNREPVQCWQNRAHKRAVQMPEIQNGSELEVCTGFKLKPEPGPYPRSSDLTRPDPSGTVKFRAQTRPEPEVFFFSSQGIANKKDAVFHDCMQRSVNKYM